MTDMPSFKELQERLRGPERLVSFRGLMKSSADMPFDDISQSYGRTAQNDLEDNWDVDESGVVRGRDTGAVSDEDALAMMNRRDTKEYRDALAQSYGDVGDGAMGAVSPHESAILSNGASVPIGKYPDGSYVFSDMSRYTPGDLPSSIPEQQTKSPNEQYRDEMEAQSKANALKDVIDEESKPSKNIPVSTNQ